MSDTEKTFVDEVHEHSELMSGKPASMEDMAKDFALYGINKRVDLIKHFRTSVNRDQIDSEPNALRKYMRDREQLKRLEGIHHKLRKAKR